MRGATMKEPNANEMNATMASEYAKHPNSPAATGAHPTPPPEQPIEPSEEAKHQWVGAKGPAQAGKP